MVLTKEELIASLQNEVRIFSHLAGKVDPSKLDYRPTPKQRSTLELLQYMAIMGPTMVALIKGGVFSPEVMMPTWGKAEAASKAMTADQAAAAIAQQSDELARQLGEWTEDDFRGEVDMFGFKKSRGKVLVDLVLGSYAAYRMQLFCYLKSSGREELNTMNLWMGMDGSMGADPRPKAAAN
jgi:hypothetical protein